MGVKPATKAPSKAAVIDLAGVVFDWQPRALHAHAPTLDIPALTLRRGERIFLHGPSGSGKSTLLALLGAVLQAQQGSVEVLGQDLGRLSASARDRFRVDHIGFIFQQFNLISYLSVLENVMLPCHFSAVRRRSAAASGKSPREEAARLLAQLDLDERFHHAAVTTLSVGQQQRVAAARALIGSPEIVIADEPTSALDAARQDGFLDLLLAQATAAGSTLLFVSHDLRLARHFTRELAMRDINRSNQLANEAETGQIIGQTVGQTVGLTSGQTARDISELTTDREKGEMRA